MGRYGYGRDFLGNQSIDVSTTEEKNFQQEVRTRVEELLVVKFQKTNAFSETEKQGLQMTVMAQIKGHSKVIFEEACHRVDKDKSLQAEMENMTKAQVEDMFMEEVMAEAENIALSEFEFERNIDVKQFMQREKEVKDRMQKGELTREEAEEILREPIVVENEYEEQKASQRYEENYRAYNQSRRTRNNSSKEEKNNQSRGERNNSSKRSNRCKNFRRSQYVPPERRKKPQTQPRNEDLARSVERTSEAEIVQ